MKSNLVTKIITDPNVGEYLVIIDYRSSLVTSYVNTNLFQYQFDKEEILMELLVVAPDMDIDDFIVNILSDPEYDSWFNPISITD